MATANSTATDGAVLQRLEKLIAEKSALAWKMHNTLAFMVQALPEDASEGLPVQNTLDDMRCDMEQLAVSLQDLLDHARRA